MSQKEKNQKEKKANLTWGKAKRERKKDRCLFYISTFSMQFEFPTFLCALAIILPKLGFRDNHEGGGEGKKVAPFLFLLSFWYFS